MPGPPHAITVKTFAPDEPRVVSISDVAEVAVELDGKTLSHQRDIGRSLGSAAIGFRIQRVPPGKRSSLKHRHLFQEEIILVLSGEGMLLHGDRGFAVRAMDCVLYLPTDSAAHTFENTGQTDLVIAAFGDRLAHEICVYPEKGLAFIERFDRDMRLPSDLVPKSSRS
jgi:uncharacterized cupin superfamily protein